MKGSGFKVNERAGENLGNHKLVYRGVDGYWWLADADAVASMPVLGITMSAITTGMKGEILKWGYIGDNSWTWAAGAEVYASTTPGELTQIAPTGVEDIVQVVAIAVTDVIIEFHGNGGGSYSPSDKVTEASYIIFTDGTNTYAKNGTTGQIDFSGADARTVINQAIASPNSNHVHIKAGPYIITQEGVNYYGIHIDKNNFLLSGDGWGTQLILDNAADNCNVIRIDGPSTNVIIEKLYINGNKDNASVSTPALFEANGIKSWTGCSDIIVQDCCVEDTLQLGIILIANYQKVLNNKLINCASHAVEILSGPGEIRGNFVSVSDRCGWGLSVDGGQRMIISDNIIKVDPTGKFVTAAINTWQDQGQIIISNNIIWDIGTLDDGTLGSPYSMQIKGNRILITDNIIRHNYTTGYMDIQAPGVVMDGNQVFQGYIKFTDVPGLGYPSIVSDNYFILSSPPQVVSGNVRFDQNVGYISPGELRSVSGSLTAGNANAICFAWNNPDKQDILIKKVVIEVTTGGGTVGSHLDIGIADDAAGTNRGTEFFNDLLLNNVAIDDSWVAGDGGTQIKWVFCEDSVAVVDDWVVGQILDANAANLVGKYYIEYAGR